MIFINDFSRGFELDLYSVCEGSPYGARIISYHTAYHGKKYDFLDFWICRNESKSAVCAFCRYYSTLIVCGSADDKQEIEDFIKMLSPSSILCDSDLNLNLDLSFTEGETMRCRKISRDCEFDFPLIKLCSDMARLRKVYDLLVNENGNLDALPDFESYFLDISHRIRHGTAEVYAVFDETGRAVSTASVTAMSDGCAVIGCVATASDCRRRGMATKLVHDITQRHLNLGRAVYLHREKKIHLYRKMGFEVVGRWKEFSHMR